MEEAPLVLVTGATGFIATHIIKELLEEGHRVRGTVRSLANHTKVQPLKELCPESKYKLELVEADLMKAETWLPTISGCTYVIHTACPVLAEQPDDPSVIIKPAVDGTLSVLEACRQVGGIKRIVLTSSVVAIISGRDSDLVFSENDWSDINNSGSPYTKAKTLSEKAAWDYIEKLPETERFELCVINPCFVLGPVLCGSMPATLTIVKFILEKKLPAVPRVNYRVVDVRDVARAHVVALTLPEAAGKRHILASEDMWMRDISLFYQEEFGHLGYNTPTIQAPDILVKAVGLFSRSAHMVVPVLGTVNKYDTTRMTSVLGIKPIPLKKTLLDSAHSMIEKGFIFKTKAYEKQHTRN